MLRTSARRPDVSDRIEAARGRAVDVTETARDRATELAGTARDRAGDLAHDLEPKARDLGDRVSGVFRTLLAVLLPLPTVLSKVLGVLSNLSGGVAERGRELADRVEPPKSSKRRSKLRTALWFLGGFGAGAATGWVVHARMHEEPVDPDLGYAGPQGAPYGDEAASIDARRANADLS